jgi:2-succinyl-5-enolpyruvyl-6-hydroxy-3-cyclohexene-1-carboxylate synthase
MSAHEAARRAGESNVDATRALVGTLVAGGVRYAVLAPGSRSGPLAMAVAERNELRTFVITDERSAAFFALGIARYYESPPLLVCTSGTAAANFAPAVAEAAIAEVPLLVATADRPPEARGFGAPQTIRQPDLFARHVRLGIDAAVPSNDGPPEQYYRALAAKALAATLTPVRGPVHLNLPFREPLIWNSARPGPAPDDGGTLRVALAELRIPPARREAIAARLLSTDRGLIVCGPTSRPRTVPSALASLAAALGWPLLADPLSGLRTHGEHARVLVEPHELLLRSPASRVALRPDLVLRFGSLPVSKALREALAGWDVDQIVVTSAEEWPDPDWRATEVVVCDAATAAADLAATLPAAVAVSENRAGWLEMWRRAADAAGVVIDSVFAEPVLDAEAWVARTLCGALASDAVLVVGNSMPIRDVDAFCTGLPGGLTVVGNRGANGIDGVLSTAFGTAAASGRPTAVLLGDLSFLHDAAAVRLGESHALPLLVVVVNNDGGGIFHSLPWADLGETFERYFATPHGLDLAATVSVPGAKAVRASSPRELSGVIADWIARPQLVIVEVVVDRRAAHNSRREAVDRISAAVDAQLRASR